MSLNSTDIRYISPFQYNPGQSSAAVTFLQGIKGGDTKNTLILTGSINGTGNDYYGLVYVGKLDNEQSSPGVSGSGKWYTINVPSKSTDPSLPQPSLFYESYGTSIYGPDNLGNGNVILVGAYTRHLSASSPSALDPDTVGFVYQGNLQDASNPSGYRSFQGDTKNQGKATFTFLHSVDHGLTVGNCDTADTDPITGYSLSSTAFIYDIKSGDQLNIVFPKQQDNETHTAYGIWYNNDGTYTIAGGSGDVLGENKSLKAGSAYLIDYDPKNKLQPFSHYTEFNYKNRSDGDVITHFEGIYRSADGSYYLPAASVAHNRDEDQVIASAVRVTRDKNGSFNEEATWKDLNVSTTINSKIYMSYETTANSMFEDVVVGLAHYNVSGSQSPVQYDFVAQNVNFF
jgi:hypothetical protein